MNIGVKKKSRSTLAKHSYFSGQESDSLIDHRYVDEHYELIPIVREVRSSRGLWI